MSKTKTKFVCQKCGYETQKWMGKCPGCGTWSSMVEQLHESATPPRGLTDRTARGAAPTSIVDIDTGMEARHSTHSGEFDRVLGGGFVDGSLMLVGGDPGIGKSTLLLQTSHRLAIAGSRVLYVSGEESTKQLRLRADRLGTLSDQLFVLSETDMDSILQQVDAVHPHFLIIDSIQTMYQASITSAPGSVSQVRECTSQLLRMAKSTGTATCIVGHVTKEGTIAGPRLLEHMVDAVLYFEGERHHSYRILRAVKNRFGSTNEIGIFEMREQGLEEVSNPSELFLSERPTNVPGSTVVASMEGTRPLLVEVQALVTPTSFGMPRRMSTGLDYNRVSLMMAVLEKRVGLVLQNQDAYVNVAGGVRLDEPAIDLGIVMAVASSFRDIPTRVGDIYIGEVGLTGEVRGVSRIEGRVREALKLGFTRCIVPSRNCRGWTPPDGIQVVGVDTLQEALDCGLKR